MTTNNSIEFSSGGGGAQVERAEAEVRRCM